MCMKFYEFNDCPYYALIGAKTETDAIKCYRENICEPDDVDEMQDFGEPDLIEEDDARNKFVGCWDCEHEIYTTNEEFNYLRDNSTEPYLLLVDGSLY